MKEAYSKQRVKLLKKNKDYDALYRYCASYALEKNWDAFLEVSKCYMHGWGVQKNEWHARMIHSELCSVDYPYGYYYLAWDHYEGKGTVKNDKKACQCFLIAAKKGVVDAMFNVGIFCYNGIGTKKDRQQAIYWFKQAAALGHAQAQFNLGVCYHKGQGVAANLIQANYWLEQASAQGLTIADRYLGQEKNHQAALQLCQMAQQLQELLETIEDNEGLEEGLEKIEKQIQRIKEKTHEN